MMPWAEFVLRQQAAAVRQLIAVEAVAIGGGNAGDEGQLQLSMLRSDAHG